MIAILVFFAGGLCGFVGMAILSGKAYEKGYKDGWKRAQSKNKEGN